MIAWRLDRTVFAPDWRKAIGAEKFGGRWSPVGMQVVYASIDPSTAILEVAAHAGFNILDVTPYSLIQIRVRAPKRIHEVHHADVPNRAWLHPGSTSAGQQAFGGDLLRKHPFVLVPSVVSRMSWNMLINPLLASANDFEEVSQEPFSLDGRLNPPAP